MPPLPDRPLFIDCLIGVNGLCRFLFGEGHTQFSGLLGQVLESSLPKRLEVGFFIGFTVGLSIADHMVVNGGYLMGGCRYRF